MHAQKQAIGYALAASQTVMLNSAASASMASPFMWAASLMLLTCSTVPFSALAAAFFSSTAAGRMLVASMSADMVD